MAFWWQSEPWAVQWAVGATDSYIQIYPVAEFFSGDADMVEYHIGGPSGQMSEVFAQIASLAWATPPGELLQAIPLAMFIREDADGWGNSTYKMVVVAHGRSPIAIAIWASLAISVVLALTFPSFFQTIVKRIFLVPQTVTTQAGETSQTILKQGFETAEMFAQRASALVVDTFNKISTGVLKGVLPWLAVAAGALVFVAIIAPKLKPAAELVSPYRRRV